MIDPITMTTMSRSQGRVVYEARDRGWSARWQHRLLILTAQLNGITYLVQVIFAGDLWGYALTFHRQRTYESPVIIVARRRDLFTHLADPR